jgi:hypothetical protein
MMGYTCCEPRAQNHRPHGTVPGCTADAHNVTRAVIITPPVGLRTEGLDTVAHVKKFRGNGREIPKVKGKGLPVTWHAGTEEEQRYSSTHS